MFAPSSSSSSTKSPRQSCSEHAPLLRAHVRARPMGAITSWKNWACAHSCVWSNCPGGGLADIISSAEPPGNFPKPRAELPAFNPSDKDHRVCVCVITFLRIFARACASLPPHIQKEPQDGQRGPDTDGFRGKGLGLRVEGLLANKAASTLPHTGECLGSRVKGGC